MGISDLNFSATNVRTGLAADLPAYCSLGDEYNATDTAKKYVCFAVDVWSVLDVGDSIRTNIALNAFRIAVNGSLVRYNLQDGVIDDFQDGSGVLSGGVVSGGMVYYVGDGQQFKLITATAGLNWACSSSYGADSGGGHWLNSVIDGATLWRGDGVAGQWITTIFPNPVRLYQYGMYPRATTESLKSWRLYGSNTGAFTGEAILLDTQTNITFTTGIFQEFGLAGTNPYTYYRVVCDANQGGVRVIVDEMEFYVKILPLISTGITAESQPTTINAVLLVDDTVIAINTDFVMSVSCDDGTTWDTITLIDEGDYNATTRILTGSVSVTTTGTTIKYKIVCSDGTFEIYAVGLLWD